jgi:putative DNA primase/helicase
MSDDSIDKELLRQQEQEQEERQKDEQEQDQAQRYTVGDDGNGHVNINNGTIVKTITEDILNRYRFITIEESREILVYEKGVYTQGGEVTIEKTAESLYGYKVANRHLAEIKGHIMRMTFHKREELDPDINIINLKNGLYNIETGEFKDHDPNYLSISQKPIIYDSASKPKRFGKYLHQVLYPTEVRTAIEIMAYTLYKENPFEIITKLFGYGANGKSVFTGLLTAIHGSRNVSNVPLSSMLKNRFALSDLENKYVNIDTELSSTTIHDTTVLKKLTGRQPVRIERKNQRAYDTTLYAKLFFSANKIPETEDDSDAYFRREIIISFPIRFEGKNQDPNLLKKLTTEEELSGIFNVLVKALRTVLRNEEIFVNEKTIEQRRERHQLAVNPLQYFLEDVIDKESSELDKTPKDTLYEAYTGFCNRHKLAVESKENLSRILKNRYRYQEDREGSGKRRRLWKGIKLTTKYAIPDLQRTLGE